MLAVTGVARPDVPSLSDGLGGFRLILHVLAATVWVGGQFTVAGLLPTIRTLGEDAPKKVARAFGRLLWPAYAVLVVTGFWNISALTVKRRLVGLEGRARSSRSPSWSSPGWPSSSTSGPPSRRAWPSGGPSAALASVAALCLGVFLAG